MLTDIADIWPSLRAQSHRATKRSCCMSGTHRFVAAPAALLLLAGLALGQVKSSTITGTVTDPSGALVPAAEVLVTNQETNVTVAVKSNAAGEYTAPYLATG